MPHFLNGTYVIFKVIYLINVENIQQLARAFEPKNINFVIGLHVIGRHLNYVPSHLRIINKAHNMRKVNAKNLFNYFIENFRQFFRKIFAIKCRYVIPIRFIAIYIIFPIAIYTLQSY